MKTYLKVHNNIYILSTFAGYNESTIRTALLPYICKIKSLKQAVSLLYIFEKGCGYYRLINLISLVNLLA